MEVIRLFKISFISLGILLYACDTPELEDINRTIENEVTLTCSSLKAEDSKHAVWMEDYKGGYSASFQFTDGSGAIEFFEDGSLHITGTISLPNKPEDRWEIDVWASNPHSWEEWQSMGRSYKGESARVGELYRNWMYYEFDVSKPRLLIGQGINEGVDLELTQFPYNMQYGLQLGFGANDKNNNYGLSVWYTYEWKGNTYRGDFNFDLGCAGIYSYFLFAEDFKDTIPNLTEAGYLIGKPEVATNIPEVSYALVSQDPPGALAIDPVSGNLYVKDAAAFRYSLNRQVTAEIEVSGQGLTEKVSSTIHVDELNGFQLSTITYFQEIALGFEFGSASRVTRRWRENMKIYVAGNPPAALHNELTTIVGEINELASNGFHVEIVENEDESNVFLFFGSADEFLELFDYNEAIIRSSFGFFSIFRNNMNAIYAGRIFIDIERTDLMQEKHALREEVTQVLGLGRDSDMYRNSIFYQGFSEVTTYSRIDKELIRLLYHPSMRVGLNNDEVAEVLREILKSE